MKKKLINLNDNKVSEIEISDKIFGIKVYPDLIHQYIRYQNAKARQGSHKTKTRSEVRGRSKKPFSQKKILRVIEGKIFDVVVDIRKNSKSFGKFKSVILSDKNKKQIYMKQGDILIFHATLIHRGIFYTNQKERRLLQCFDCIPTDKYNILKNIEI